MSIETGIVMQYGRGAGWICAEAVNAPAAKVRGWSSGIIVMCLPCELARLQFEFECFYRSSIAELSTFAELALS